MYKMPSSSNLSQHRNLGLMVLSIIFFSIVHPLSLSFLPHLSGIIGLFLMQRQERISLYPYKNMIAILTLICVVACLSTFWSLTPDITLRRSLKVSAGILLFIPFLILIDNLKDETISFIKRYASIPIILGGLYLLIELAFGLPFLKLFMGKEEQAFAWQYNKHVVSLILIAPFMIFFLSEYKKLFLAIVVFVLCLIVAFLTDSQAAQLAAITMILVTIGYRLAPKFIFPLCFGGVFLVLIAMPWISNFAYDSFTDMASANNILGKASMNQRLEIWDFVSLKIFENPWIGYGVDATRSIEFAGRMVYYQNAFVLHPHNIALQIWIELGVFGIFITSCFILLLYLHLKRLSGSQQSLQVIGFSGVIVVMLVSWSIWSGWLIGLLLLLVSLSKVSRFSYSNNHPY